MTEPSEDIELYTIGEKVLGERSPFSQILGLKMDFMDDEMVCLKFTMRNDLIASIDVGALHGGVIASSLDMAGGLVVFLNAFRQARLRALKNKSCKPARFDTIDLRVDYLRPGRGNQFTAKAWILRAGKKVAVARMELHNDENRLIAVGTGTYLSG